MLHPCIWVCRVVRIFVVLHCVLEHACLARRWIWLCRPFDASPRVGRVLAYVRHRLLLYVGHEVVYPTGWPFCFLITGDLRPPHRIQVATFASGSSWGGDYRRTLLQC